MSGTSYQHFELQDMLSKIPFLILSFESGNCGKRWEKTAKDGINRGKKHFSNFLKCFLLVKYEKQKTQALNLNTQIHTNVDIV